MPFSTLSSVDFPAPFSPMRPKTSPRPTAKLTLSSALTPGKDFEIPRSSRTGSTSSLLFHDIEPRAVEGERHGDDDEQTLNALLYIRLASHEDHSVGEHYDDQHADHRVEHRADAARERRAADDDSGNRGKQPALADERVALAE